MKQGKLKDFLLDILEKKELIVRRFVNPEKYIKKIFWQRMHRNLDLDNPKTYSEKLQWLKLYYHDSLLTKLVDKYEVKKYVADKIGKQYVIPTLGVWDKFNDIDFSSLPNQFVLKCTHDSGGLVICKDKSNLDIKAARKIINSSLKRNFYYMGYEWPYKDVLPRIIAEEYKEDTVTKELRDYKFFCFRGLVKAMFVATGRHEKNEDVKFDFFDENYIHLPFRQGHENANILPEKPLCFEEMKLLASRLSEGLPHARVDFYEVNGSVFFGEITFFHHGGWTPFDPEEWDVIFGSWLNLPEKRII